MNLKKLDDLIERMERVDRLRAATYERRENDYYLTSVFGAMAKLAEEAVKEPEEVQP